MFPFKKIDGICRDPYTFKFKHSWYNEWMEETAFKFQQSLVGNLLL